MNKRGSVIIISSDDNVEIFQKEIPIGKEHIDAIREYDQKYNLGYNFKDDDYHFAPCTLSIDGHLIIKTEYFMKQLLVYLPEVVSDRQLNYLKANQSKYQNEYLFTGGYYLNNGEFYRMHAVGEIIVNAEIKNIEHHKINNISESKEL